MPVFSARVRFRKQSIRAKHGGQRNVEVDVANAVSVGNITVRSDGEFAWSNDTNARKGLITVDNLRRSGRRCGMKQVLWHGERMEQGDAKRSDKVVVALVEAAPECAVQQRFHQLSLVVDLVLVNLGEILHTQRLREHLVDGISVRIEQESPFIAKGGVGDSDSVRY